MAAMSCSRLLSFAAALLLFGSACGKVEKPGNGVPEEQTPAAESTLFGTVRGNDGKPLEGVLVSDGLYVTKTDASGAYGLPGYPGGTDYVFVSTPSGYSAPVRDGIPVFWIFLKDASKGSDGKYHGLDFTLEKIADPERFSIIIYADPQPRSRSDGYDRLAYHSLDVCEDMYKDMKEQVGKMGGRPVYGICLGDVVHRDLSLIPDYKRGMAGTGIISYHVIGNHDHDVTKSSDRDAARTFESHFGPVNYSFNLGKFHIVVLDNMIAPVTESGRISDNCGNGLTDEIWEWLQNDLVATGPKVELIVCAHSPMFRLPGGKDRSANHAADYRKILSRFPKVYAFAGHTHISHNYVNIDDPVIETHTLTRVTGQLWTNEYVSDNGTPRGYIVAEYDHGKFSWKYKPLYYQTGAWDASYGGNSKKPSYTWRDWNYIGGRALLKSSGQPLDDNYQMQLFAPGVYEANKLYANIFLWDELWETPVFEYGGNHRKMTRVSDNRYSYATREIIEFFKANNSALASENYNLSDSNTDSMFSVFVNDEHGMGTVSVTDRFGETFSQEISW